MKVINGKSLDFAGIKNQSSNMAEKCFNAYKNESCMCYAYDTKVSETFYYDYDEILLAAKRGELRAMFEAGFLYESGICFKKDLKKALEWYEKGAKSGDDACQLALYYMYRFGNGVEHNPYKSIFWLKLSAQNGNSAAMYNLGEAYIEGFVEETDADEALYWLKKSAQAGCADAMLLLGCMSEKGLYASVDFNEAYKWYLAAARAGSSKARIFLAQLAFDNFSYEDKRTKKAVRYLNKSVKTDDDSALFLLGKYYKSLGGEHCKKAFKLLKRSADICGNVLAAFEVAEMYEAGCGVKADAVKAVEYYSRVLNLV